MLKAGQRLDAVEIIALAGFDEMNGGIKKVGQQVSAQGSAFPVEPRKQNASEKNFFEKAGKESRHESAENTRQRLRQGEAKERGVNVGDGHGGEQRGHGGDGETPANQQVARGAAPVYREQPFQLGGHKIAA
jgi:hypothetical protein